MKHPYCRYTHHAALHTALPLPLKTDPTSGSPTGRLRSIRLLLCRLAKVLHFHGLVAGGTPKSKNTHCFPWATGAELSQMIDFAIFGSDLVMFLRPICIMVLDDLCLMLCDSELFVGVCRIL